MFKKRAQSRKKKIQEFKLNRSKPSSILDKADKNIYKKHNILYHPNYYDTNFKSAFSTPNSLAITKATKSSAVTPKVKSRQSSKENIGPRQTILHQYEKKKHLQNIMTLQVDEDIGEMGKSVKNQNKRSDYRFIYQIGSGGFGKVWKVEDKKQKKYFAMKEMSKAKIISKKSVSSIMNEKQLLEEMKSSFIINSYCNFQDRQNLYLVMEYLRGGDLRYHMCFYEYFDEDQTKFIAASIILGLQYIHSLNIIHRDIKPQNIIFQENGYPRITDFGVARKMKSNNSEQTSGTPGYMSPEVICRMNHSFEADFFALGVIVFQLIFGMRPYMGDSRKEIRQKILAHQVQIHKQDLPSGWSSNSVDFINRLLKRNKQERLGYHGIHQLKDHPWLISINWNKLARKDIRSPFVPGVICQSIQYQRQMQSSTVTQINQETAMFLRTPQVQKIFKKYDNTQKFQRRKPQILHATASYGAKKWH